MDILELQKKLDDLSRWRKLELSKARMLAENSIHHEEKQYLCRVWVLVMYAHCDNFLKEAAKIYIDFLNDNPDFPFSHKLMWLVFKGQNAITKKEDKKYKSFKEYHESEDRDSFFQVLKSEEIFKRSFHYESLRFFCDWVLQINFSHADLSDFCETLTKKRNSIAHGEESYIEVIQDCLSWHEKTIKFIESFKEALLLSASQPIPSQINTEYSN